MSTIHADAANTADAQVSPERLALRQQLFSILRRRLPKKEALNSEATGFFPQSKEGPAIMNASYYQDKPKYENPPAPVVVAVFHPDELRCESRCESTDGSTDMSISDGDESSDESITDSTDESDEEVLAPMPVRPLKFCAFPFYSFPYDTSGKPLEPFVPSSSPLSQWSEVTSVTVARWGEEQFVPKDAVYPKNICTCCCHQNGGRYGRKADEPQVKVEVIEVIEVVEKIVEKVGTKKHSRTQSVCAREKPEWAVEPGVKEEAKEEAKPAEAGETKAATEAVVESLTNKAPHAFVKAKSLTGAVPKQQPVRADKGKDVKAPLPATSKKPALPKAAGTLSTKATTHSKPIQPVAGKKAPLKPSTLVPRNTSTKANPTAPRSRLVSATASASSRTSRILGKPLAFLGTSSGTSSGESSGMSTPLSSKGSTPSTTGKAALASPRASMVRWTSRPVKLGTVNASKPQGKDATTGKSIPTVRTGIVARRSLGLSARKGVSDSDSDKKEEQDTPEAKAQPQPKGRARQVLMSMSVPGSRWF